MRYREPFALFLRKLPSGVRRFGIIGHTIRTTNVQVLFLQGRNRRQQLRLIVLIY